MEAANTILVVEGLHDLEVMARLLGCLEFKRLSPPKDVAPPEWNNIADASFHKAGDPEKRLPLPVFFRCNSGRIAVVTTAKGVANIAPRLARILKPLAFFPDSVGIVLDADRDNPISQHLRILEHLRGEFKARNVTVQFPGCPGIVENYGNIRTGVFIAPDNAAEGTMEDILLQGADIVYRHQLSHAWAFIDGYPKAGLTDDEVRCLEKGSNRKKAVVHALAACLRPGRAIQVSIKDNRWLEGAALQQPLVKGLLEFLRALIN
ncbi:MAG: DUF3226 domain-containing protein [Limisphaerales bacterium]